MYGSSCNCLPILPHSHFLLFFNRSEVARRVLQPREANPLRGRAGAHQLRPRKIEDS